MKKIEIQWIKLRRICERLSGKEVHIQASTDIDMKTRSGVIQKDNKVDILINLNLIKRLDAVINALSHELSHITLNTSNDNLIGGEWLRLRDEIKKLYKE